MPVVSSASCSASLGFGFSDLEHDAIVADFLSRYSDAEQTNGALHAKPCACTRPLPLTDEHTEERCHWCGREPLNA